MNNCFSNLAKHCKFLLSISSVQNFSKSFFFSNTKVKGSARYFYHIPSSSCVDFQGTRFVPLLPLKAHCCCTSQLQPQCLLKNCFPAINNKTSVCFRYEVIIQSSISNVFFTPPSGDQMRMNFQGVRANISACVMYLWHQYTALIHQSSL